MERTLQLQKILDEAMNTAKALGSDFVTDDILFKALYSEIQYDVLGRMLYSFQVSLYSFSSRLYSAFRQQNGGEDIIVPEACLSDETLDTLQIAEEYAIRAYQDQIDVSHVLLALLESKNELVHDFLHSGDINLKQVKKEIMQFILVGEVESMIVTSVSTKVEKTKSTPKIILDICEDLTLAATKGEIDPIIGREKETEMII